MRCGRDDEKEEGTISKSFERCSREKQRQVLQQQPACIYLVLRVTVDEGSKIVSDMPARCLR